jgi:hypothetical protein
MRIAKGKVLIFNAGLLSAVTGSDFMVKKNKHVTQSI